MPCKKGRGISRSLPSLASVRTTRRGVSTYPLLVPDLECLRVVSGVCVLDFFFFLGLHGLDKVIGLIIILLNMLCFPEAASASSNQGQALHA